VTCPDCKVTIDANQYGLIHQCGSLLIIKNGELKDFNKTIHEECAAWPEDGKGTKSLAIGEKMNAELHPIKTVTQFKTMYDIIFELHRLGAVLTGSRAFGMEHATSDWDFVISEQNWLQDSSIWDLFKGEPNTEYTDGNTKRVFSAKAYPIHVQVSKDIDKKLAAQELLISMPDVMKMKLLGMESKIERRRVWDWALDQVGGKN